MAQKGIYGRQCLATGERGVQPGALHRSRNGWLQRNPVAATQRSEGPLTTVAEIQTEALRVGTRPLIPIRPKAGNRACGPLLAPVGSPAPPLLWTTGTTASIEAGLPVHITSMKMPSAWWRRARCRKSAAIAFDWSIMWTAISNERHEGLDSDRRGERWQVSVSDEAAVYVM
jgi:hypothetical protein